MFFNKSKKLLKEKEQELEQALKKLSGYEFQFKDIIDKNIILEEKASEVEQYHTILNELEVKYQGALSVLKRLVDEVGFYDESREIMSYGLYRPQFTYDTSEKFKKAIDINYQNQKDLIKEDGAVVCHTEWSVGGSKIEGLKGTKRFNKLMLYAFNGECDSLISKVKWNNVVRTKERINKAFESINKLGESQQSVITVQFLNLKFDELSLTYEYERKKYDEKEEQRIIREQMREEEKALRDFQRAQKDAEDEERRFEKALLKAREELLAANSTDTIYLNEKVKELEVKLQEAHERKERAIAQAQLTKIGHIYVISNVGSFGEDVYKIGMTRRLDPLDRVKELGDASVPFHFDVHAIIYSENAPQLEYELHKRFSERRLNKVNHKKEFFKITLDEIESFVNEHADAEIEFTKLAEAREYRETLSLIEQINQVIGEMQEGTKFPKSVFN